MDTLLTEIIGFLGTAKGIPACQAGPQLRLYFSMLRMQNRSASVPLTISIPRPLQRRSARKPASRLISIASRSFAAYFPIPAMTRGPQSAPLLRDWGGMTRDVGDPGDS